MDEQAFPIPGCADAARQNTVGKGSRRAQGQLGALSGQGRGWDPLPHRARQ